MNLHSLDPANLIERFAKLVKTERKITHHILECISEIDRRRIYLDLAYPSLFEYLTRAHGYSSSAAQRRIDAARLLRQIPEVGSKIEAGTLNLSQISLVAQSARRSEKDNLQTVSMKVKTEILEKLESKSFFESQALVAEHLNLSPVVRDREQISRDGYVTLTMTLTAEEYESWTKAKALIAHAVPSLANADVFNHLVKCEISRRLEIKRASVSTSLSRPRSVSQGLRKRVFKSSISDSESSPACGYTDPESGRVCGSKHFLQIDHIQPVWAQGENAIENLRVLCASHNRHRYLKQAGVRPARAQNPRRLLRE